MGYSFVIALSALGLGCLLPILLVVLFVLPGRVRMEIQAKKILTQIPNHERKSVFVPFPCAFYQSQKQVVIDEIIAEMKKEGWVYLKAGEANPLKTIKYIGGGINMYFIRNLDDENQTQIG